jgi:hypothetical protein
MVPPYEKPVLLNFQVVSGSLAVGSIGCGNGLSVNADTCSTGKTVMNYCSLGCAAMISCASGGDIMGMCMGMQCCDGSVPVAPLDAPCITGGTARWDCRTGSIYDQPCCCTSTCINTVNCTTGS